MAAGAIIPGLTREAWGECGVLDRCGGQCQRTPHAQLPIADQSFTGIGSELVSQMITSIDLSETTAWASVGFPLVR